MNNFTLEDRLMAPAGEFVEELLEELYVEHTEHTMYEIFFLELNDMVQTQWPVPQRCPRAIYARYIKAAVLLMGLRHAMPDLTEENVWDAIHELNQEVMSAIEKDCRQCASNIDWRKEGF